MRDRGSQETYEITLHIFDTLIADSTAFLFKAFTFNIETLLAVLCLNC